MRVSRTQNNRKAVFSMEEQVAIFCDVDDFWRAQNELCKTIKLTTIANVIISQKIQK